MVGKRSTSAGGVFIAMGAIGGVIVGRLYGETSAGLLSGVGVGAVIAIAIWVIDRAR